MMDDIKTWKCGHCPFTLPLPSPSAYLYDIAIMYIKNHRLEHLIVMLDGATDDDLIEMCKDGPMTLAREIVDKAMTLRPFDKPAPTDPVRGDDVKPVLAGVEALLKADLPRARKEQGI